MLRAALEPPKQATEATITTLSSRLANATLLEDRRSSILGLRSFADEYPASVASTALRELIDTLRRDVADVDTGKVVLETLLKIVNPKPESPEASDQVALWVADQFTQRQDNITLLLDLLENDDFYSRLYPLQLLQAISESRPERTQEGILSAPLGIGRLVATLNDRREAVQSAGVLLLNELTQGSIELQKVVAFENAFERLFALIRADGALAAGRNMTEDCMNLLAKLLDLNASNQSLFRESGCVGRFAQLLNEDAHESASTLDAEPDVQLIREKNIWGLLTLLRMFLVEGNPGCKANQTAFEKQKLLQFVLDLAFSSNQGPPLRAEALRTCADIIRGNSQIQERFAHSQVPRLPLDKFETSGVQHVNGESKVYVIDALLDTALSTPSLALFDVRYAANECIHAYLYNHTPIRRHFLRRAIDGHAAGEDETSNVVTILMQGSKGSSAADPYRIWFAAELFLQLISDDAESKDMARSIEEGDADKGEDVVTCIQAMSGNLLENLQAGDEDRVCIAYFMVLCVWLFEDADGVNDLLSEGSTIQSLLRSASQDGRGKEITQGLSAVLLGIIYEFSSKDSPIPRRKLQPLLTSSLGRDHYVAKIKRVRESPLIRDFEVLPQGLASTQPGSLPEVYFDQVFIDFLKDNISRLVRAIDRDPGIEVARVFEGIDRDLVDSLRGQIQDKSEALEKAQAQHLDVQGKLGQEQADQRRSQERFSSELARIKNINEALQRGHEEDTERIKAEHSEDRRRLTESHRQKLEGLEAQLRSARQESESQSQFLEQKHEDAVQELERQHQSRSSKEQQQHQEALESQRREHDIKSRELGEQYSTKIEKLEKQLQDMEEKGGKSIEAVDKLRQLNDMLTKRIKERDEQLESRSRDKLALEEDIESRIVASRKFEEQVKQLKDQVKALEARTKESGKEQTELQLQLDAKEEARFAAQTELDDLLMILSDLEEKRKQDKRKIKDLGGSTSDDEDEDDEDEDEEGEGEGEQDEDEEEEGEQGGNDDEGGDEEADAGPQKAHSKAGDGKTVDGDDVDQEDGVSSDDEGQGSDVSHTSSRGTEKGRRYNRELSVD